MHETDVRRSVTGLAELQELNAYLEGLHETGATYGLGPALGAAVAELPRIRGLGDAVMGAYRKMGGELDIEDRLAFLKAWGDYAHLMGLIGLDMLDSMQRPEEYVQASVERFVGGAREGSPAWYEIRERAHELFERDGEEDPYRDWFDAQDLLIGERTGAVMNVLPSLSEVEGLYSGLHHHVDGLLSQCGEEHGEEAARYIKQVFKRT